MKRLIILAAIFLTACASGNAMPSFNSLRDLGPAADFNSTPWLNTAQPLTLSGLRGKVVLVEFWTFG